MIAHRVSGVSTCDASVTTQPASATQPLTMSRPRPAFATTNGSLGGHQAVLYFQEIVFERRAVLMGATFIGKSVHLRTTKMLDVRQYHLRLFSSHFPGEGRLSKLKPSWIS